MDFNKQVYIKQLAAGVGENVSRWNLDTIFNGFDTPGAINKRFMEHLIALKTRRRAEREAASEGSSIDLRDFEVMTTTTSHLDALKATVERSEANVINAQTGLRTSLEALRRAQHNYQAALAPSAHDEVPLKRDALVKVLNEDERIKSWEIVSARRNGSVTLKVVVNPFSAYDNLPEARYRSSDPWFVNETELLFIFNGGAAPRINARAIPGLMYEGAREMSGYCRYHFYVGHPRNPTEPHEICLGRSATDIAETFASGNTAEGVLKTLDLWTRYDCDNPFVPFNQRAARFKYGENGTVTAHGGLDATEEDLRSPFNVEFTSLNSRYIVGDGGIGDRIPGRDSPDWDEHFFSVDYGMDYLWLKNRLTGEYSAYILGVPTNPRSGDAVVFNFDGELVDSFGVFHNWSRVCTDEDVEFLKMGRERTDEALKDLNFVKWCARGIYTRLYADNVI